MKVCMVAFSVYALDNRIKRYVAALSEDSLVDIYCIGSDLPSENRTRERKNVRVFDMAAGKLKSDSLVVYLLHFMLFFGRTFFALTRRTLMEGRYDLVHVHNLPDPLVFVALVPKLLGARIILDIHDILPEFYIQKFGTRSGWRYTVLRLIEKISVRFADHVIVANHLWCEKIMARNGLDERKCTTIMNYPNLEIFRYRHRPKKKQLTMVYHGTLSRIHGTDILVEAINLLRQRFPRVRADVYGSFTEAGFERKIRGMIAEYGLEDNFRLLPLLSHELVGDRLQEYCMGVVPKRDGFFSGEAFSTKLLEYMAVGLPVVASRTRIDEYYFTDEDVAFFEPGNARDLAAQIVSLFEDAAGYERKKEKGLMTAGQFDWNTKKDRYAHVLAGG
ncbi:MAG TPA: glycosyltransferase family 4 protein [Desulfomicrobiaceae bacterium]|nr:glycosyltransferase family 4 protein [Desulfomicrobiaceae bacterium]